MSLIHIRNFYRPALTGAVLFLALGCSSNPEQEIHHVIRSYNEAMVDAYLRPDPALVARYATDQERGRVREYIFYMIKNKHLLDCQLMELSFVTSEIDPDKAFVLTRERWTCRKIHHETREALDEAEPYFQDVRYEMVRLEGHWLVHRTQVFTPNPTKNSEAGPEAGE